MRQKGDSGVLVSHPSPLEGWSVHASPFPWKGLPSAARRGWLPFGAAKPPPPCLPHWEMVTAPAVDRVLSQTAYLRRSSSLFFTPPSPSNLRPFGAPPSIGRREHLREPLPLEGAAERSEAGLASFFAAKPPPLCLPHAGKALSIGIVFPTYPVFALTIWG